MHETCFELLLSERYVKDDVEHIKMMKNFNTKTIKIDDLCRQLGERDSSNMNITDDEIAAIFSDKKAMILAADNATCDQINCFMARVQAGDQEHKSKVQSAN